jgi:mRNA-degrading endonuclease toxin of MazEF toxin-antitoxin module
MKVRRSEIVIIDHPFSDASGSKVRPALVVQADKRNAVLTETIVAFITKSLGSVA